MEQKREWTLQLKRVILENYDAVIPHHARQLVLQLGSNSHHNDHCDDDGGDVHNHMHYTHHQHQHQELQRRKSSVGDRLHYSSSGSSSNNNSNGGSSGLERSSTIRRHQHSAPEYLQRRKQSTAGLLSAAKKEKEGSGSLRLPGRKPSVCKLDAAATSPQQVFELIPFSCSQFIKNFSDC